MYAFKYRPRELDDIKDDLAQRLCDMSPVQGYWIHDVVNAIGDRLADDGMDLNIVALKQVRLLQDPQALYSAAYDWLETAVERGKINLAEFDYDEQYSAYESYADDCAHAECEDW